MTTAAPDWGVQATADLARILTIPRRTWSDAQRQAAAQHWDQQLRMPGSTWSLHPDQGAALSELAHYKGMNGLLDVGAGKTLVGYLAPQVISSRKPLLLTRAGLIGKTQREALDLAKEYRIAGWLRIVSYEALGRVGYQGFLERYDPDLIIADEAHMLKNKSAGVTKRVLRFLKERDQQGRRCPFVIMTGTFVREKVTQYAHLIRYTAPPGWSWLPYVDSEVDDWSSALDEGIKVPMPIGALVALGPGVHDQRTARDAYRERMLATPTVIATQGATIGSSLEIREIHIPPPQPDIVEACLAKLRTWWLTPDDWPLNSPADVWRVEQELALGFYSSWDPRPPEEWKLARQAFSKAVRYLLGNNRRNLDTELEVVNAIDRGLYGPGAQAILARWRTIRPTFTPNVVARWVSDHVIDAIAHRFQKERDPLLVWAWHIPFATALAAKSGVSYFHNQGLDAKGIPIESHQGHAILSVASNKEGRNLQYGWHRNLITYPGMPADMLEQVMGRTHRKYQRADTVDVELLVQCAAHRDGIDRSIANARYALHMHGIRQKLTYADLDRNISGAPWANRYCATWDREYGREER